MDGPISNMTLSSVSKAVEEETQKAAAQVQLQKYAQFFEEYTDSLDLVRSHLPPSTFSRNHIRLDFKPREGARPGDLVNGENRVVDKVLIVFSALCSEADFVRMEACSYYDAVLRYGENVQDDAPYEDCQLALSRALPTLQNLSNFLKHCERVTAQIVAQLSGFYRLNLEITESHMEEVFKVLSDVMIAVVIAEELLSDNASLAYHWSLYKRTIQVASHAASEFSYETRSIRLLSQLSADLERRLLSGRVFEDVLTAAASASKPSKRLQEEFGKFLRNLQVDLEEKSRRENGTDMIKYARLCVAFALHANIFAGAYDKRVAKSLTDLAKKFPLVALHSNAAIRADKFLLDHAGPWLKAGERKALQQAANVYEAYTQDIRLKLERDASYYAKCALAWSIRFRSALRRARRSSKVEATSQVSNLLLEGLRCCSRIRALLVTLSKLHVDTGAALSRSCAITLCRMMEILRCVRTIYEYEEVSIATIANNAIHMAQYHCLVLVETARKGMHADNLREKDVDTVSALAVALDALVGAATPLRVTLAKLAVDLSGRRIDHLEERLETLRTLSSLRERVEAATDCGFLKWNKGSVPLYLDEAKREGQSDGPIRYFFDAEFQQDFQRRLLAPLAQTVEENLRLHTLRHLATVEENAAEAAQRGNIVADVRIIKPAHFHGKCLDIKRSMELHLSKNFYDLTSVALHDWQIYGEMRSLAALKFDLHPTDGNLPQGTLEQGLDLLCVTRDVETFARNYAYDSNNQTFVETDSKNKYFNVIGVQQAANSIRTHGSGVIDTAVNCAYKFLRECLNEFSQFLYNEEVTSRLHREVAAFRDSKDPKKRVDMVEGYPFEKAERFYRAAKKSGKINLDNFRGVVTRIGNTLGFVRMIRSAALRYFSEGAAYVPELVDRQDTLESSLKAENFGQGCLEAGHNLDDLLRDMRNNVSADYFRLLVNVFESALASESNDHVRLFHIILPALTMNFVEGAIAGKEALQKGDGKGKGSRFVDDGFATGCSYLLRITKGNEAFDALCWFESVFRRNKNMREGLEGQTKGTPKMDDKLQQTLNLSLKRLDIYEKEFSLLFYNFHSSRVLFRDRE